MKELLKTLYWNLYIPYKNQEAEQELDDCHKQLVNVLGKPERKLVLRIIDGKDRLADEIGLDSFIFGFKLATQLAHELKKYDGHLRSDAADEDVRRSILSEEEDPICVTEKTPAPRTVSAKRYWIRWCRRSFLKSMNPLGRN